MEAIDLSVVIPCYHEAQLLIQSVDELIRVLNGTRCIYELIFVDDASRDETVRMIQECCRRYASIPTQVIVHPTNLGRGRTVTDGCRVARGRLIGYLDIDLEVHARYVPAMISAIDDEGYEGAVAWRIYKLARPVWFRALCSRGYHWLVRLTLGLPYRDTEAGFKFFKREPLMRVLARVQHGGWFWDTEVMAHAWLQGLRIKEIPCLFIRRTDKRSSVRVWRDTWQYLRDLLQFRRQWLQCPPHTSLLYRVPWLYRLAMAVLYRQRTQERFQAVARYIPTSGVSVLDVCSGDCGLHDRCLRDRAVEYLGVDLNPRLLHAGARGGARVQLMDVRCEELPGVDVVVMHASLYQFIPHHQAMMKKLLQAARRRLILVEPIQNWATDSRSWRRRLASRLTDPGTGSVPHRFSRADLEQLFAEFGASEIVLAANGRELIGVFERNGAPV